MQEELNQRRFGLIDNTKDNLFGVPDKYDYSKFITDGFELDDELKGKFQPLAQKLNLSQESLEMLLEIALEMSKKQRAMYEKDEQDKLCEQVTQYDKMFREDSEIPDSNSISIRRYMELANSAYCEFCSPKLKEIFEKTGLNFHPELIKMFHRIGELSQEDNLSNDGRPSTGELSPAEILYGPRE